MRCKYKLVLMILTILFCSVLMVACKKTTIDLMKGLSKKEVTKEDKLSLNKFEEKYSKFAWRIFNQCRLYDGKEKNTLISPISIFIALSMVTNGAEEETLIQMEEMLGMTKVELNNLVYAYINLLSERNPHFGKLILVNSIWYRNDPSLIVKQDFLQTAKDYYDGDIFKALFNSDTLKEINDWVDEKTGGAIPAIIDDISDEAIMYLVNALSFDAEWQTPYLDSQVKDDVFITSDGKKETLPYLYGQENTFLEDEKATGFIKFYRGCRYGFAAMLPNDGVSVDEYLDYVGEESIIHLLSGKRSVLVNTAMPKFGIEYMVEMKEQLNRLGITLAFDVDNADFKNMAESSRGNIFIDKIIHKTFIVVDEKGTKAGAATIVETTDGALPLTETCEVYLNRPFVYMLIDCENDIPLFIGVMRDPEL